MVDLDAVEGCLDVGRPAVLYVSARRGGDLSVRVIIRGWQRGSYLLLDLPNEDSLGIGPRVGDACKLRFLADGDACGFETTLIDLGSGSHFSYVRVGWPHAMTRTRVRKHQRVQVQLPCTIDIPDAPPISCMIQDLSVGGCRIELDRMVTQRTQFKLSFQLPGDSETRSLSAEVCAASAFTGGAWLGCKYLDIDDELQYDIEFYVTMAAARLRSEYPHSNHVLIIDPNLHEVSPLRHALTAKGYEVTVAPNVQDGFFWLRAMPPTVLMLHAAPTPFTGVDVVKSLRALRAHAHTPVILYAASATDVKAATDAGATQAFAANAQVQELVTAVCAAAPITG